MIVFYNKCMETLEQLFQDIKNLKIQGATNIALATIRGLTTAVDKLKRGNPSDPDSFLISEITRLANARPTEPLAQNAVRYIFSQKSSGPEIYLQKSAEYEKMIADSKYKMAGFGTEFIKDGGIYLTHCHSSTVTNMFINAYKSGKKFKIYVTETRPLYQGRITARELLDAGLPDVTMIIDDVATSLLLENKMGFSAVFIGADLLSQDGFINKVGSIGIAYCTRENNLPLYCISILLKYDPKPYSDNILELRNPQEIWPDAPKKLQFYTPAFDFIPYYPNVFIITETGILQGSEVYIKAPQTYSFLS